MPRVEAAPLAEGTRLGAYRVLGPLGSGGMGEVYLGERADGAFEQQVAIKVIGTGGLLGPELLERFLAERQLLAEMKHPNIAHLVDGGTVDDGRPYLVMEHVEGKPIDQYCKRRNLSVEARLRLFLRVCDAVEHAHRHLVVHRDLKPGNILVTGDGVPKLLDFGVAKDVGEGEKTPATRFLVPVTPEYASPEQLTGGPVTTAVDVYALGVVLYELLAGHSPFGDGEDPLAGRSRAAPPSRPSSRIRRRGGREARRLRRLLTGDLDHIVLRALEPNPEMRYASVEQLSRDLDHHLRRLPLETREGALYRIGKLAHRHWKGLIAAAVTSILAAGLVSGMVERRQLERESERVTRLSNALGNYLVRLFLQADPARTGERSEALDRMLDHGAELLGPETFADEPQMRAVLLGAIGQVYRRQDRLAKAEELLRKSLELRRRFLPPDHEDIGLASNNLGLVLRGLGYYPEARDLLSYARDILERHYPGDHRDIAILLNNLAGVEKELGHFAEAVELFREALEMKRRLPDVFGPEEIVKAIKNLGTGHRAMGDLDQAEATFGEALHKLSRLDEVNPLVRAGVEHHRGSLCRERGDIERARELLEGALETRGSLLGAAHRQSVETLLELALVDQAEGRPDLAEERLRGIVEVRRGQLGSEHPDVAEALVPLARLLAERGDFPGA
ncbi:MAG: serine/threonine protein kinase, partial [bacterium]|nr:serine/threonine protein kinase [bacterium]